MLETLRPVEASFEPITRPRHALPDAYIARGTAPLKVEFLTPMRGPNEDAPAPLRALGTGATPLRFLDYLIYQDRKAAILHGAGVLVNVPDPARFAWHKLILSQRRAQPEKVPKDLMQAQTLLEVLMTDRPDDVRRHVPRWPGEDAGSGRASRCAGCGNSGRARCARGSRG